MQFLTQSLQSMADSIDFPHLDQWLEDYIDIPVICATLYLVLVLWVPDNFMKNRPPYNLRALNIMWNLFLSSFSMVGAYYCVPRLYEMVTAPVISGLDPSELRYVSNMTRAMRRNILIPENFQEGVDAVGIRGSFDTSVCVWKDDMYRRNITGLLSVLFMFSKIPEMMDTAFLVFQKKRIMFLHWYHHTTVMLYCWHAWITPTSSGLWFVSMNFVVHSIMYFYYFMCACGQRKLVGPFAPLITLLQIAQMIMGTVIAVYVFYMDNFGDGCDCSSSNAKLSLAMYLSYFVLFSQFFKNRYMSPKKVKMH